MPSLAAQKHDIRIPHELVEQVASMSQRTNLLASRSLSSWTKRPKNAQPVGSQRTRSPNELRRVVFVVVLSRGAALNPYSTPLCIWLGFGLWMMDTSLRKPG